MTPNKFSDEATLPGNQKWEAANQRIFPIEQRPDEIRSDFCRDYNRILHCNAYRRLKHKTQVFFSTKNDHICTRIEHVNHVTSVSYSISKFLGLNTELTDAIAIGHDLGHAPFGHSGENKLKQISKAELGVYFWHEKNSLRVIDYIELLQNSSGHYTNLNLTYAVRDGIVSHCGEVDEKSIFPRKEDIDLHLIHRPNEYSPFTWEACVVKIADKIAYLGRDIEDAIRLNILTDIQLRYLHDIVNIDIDKINNTALIHGFIIDLCKHSSPEEGIRMSDEYLKLMHDVKKFNYQHIYNHPRLHNYVQYADLVLDTLFKVLTDLFDGEQTLNRLNAERKIYPKLMKSFIGWLEKYTLELKNTCRQYQNYTLYDLKDRRDYCAAIIDFIASMTDQFAIELFEEQTRF